MHRAALSVVLLLAATACRTLAPAVPVPAVPLPADDPRPPALLEAWAKSAGQRRAMRGVARLAVDGGDGAVHLPARQVVVVAERPSRLRIEVVGFLGQTVASLVTDGDRFELFQAGEPTFQTGYVRPGLLFEVAYIALRPEEAIDLLLGSLAPHPAVVLGGSSLQEDGAIRLELVDAGGTVLQRAAFDARGRLRWVEMFDPEGEARWQARFDDYKELDGLPFAHSILLDVVAGKTHAELSLRNIELNPELPADIFRLRLPALPIPRKGG